MPKRRVRNLPHPIDLSTSYLIYLASRLIYFESSKKFNGAWWSSLKRTWFNFNAKLLLYSGSFMYPRCENWMSIKQNEWTARAINH